MRCRPRQAGILTGVKRILVTGARGYIGAHAVRALVAMGAEVVAVDRPGAARPPEDDGALHLEADIFADSSQLLERTGAVDACLHLAWEAGFVHDAPTHMLRLSDHFRFLDGLAQAGVPQIAVLGTMHEVGYFEGMVTETTPTKPRSLYGVAKNALREALDLRLNDSPTTFQWLRCFYIYGDDARNRSVFTKLADAAASGVTTFPFNTGRNRYDFIEVGELGRQIAAVLMQTEVDGIINCCSGEPVALADRVEQYIRDKGYAMTLDYGAFPDREYDSPAIWGDASKIHKIMDASAGRPVVDGSVRRANGGSGQP